MQLRSLTHDTSENTPPAAPGGAAGAVFFQVLPFQVSAMSTPGTSAPIWLPPTATHREAVRHDTLSALPSSGAARGGSGRQVRPFHRSLYGRGAPPVQR